MASSVPNKPTVLMVQGSYQIPEVYGKLTQTLEAEGYPTVHPPLPSLYGHDAPDFPTKTIATDALAVQLELRHLVQDEGKNVVILMHSYGGLVGSEAMLGEFSRRRREEMGLVGGVIHLFYFAALILDQGQAPGENSETLDVRPDGRFSIKNPAVTLYGDLLPQEAEYWASKIVDQSYAVLTSELSRAPCRDVPSTYLVCEKDQAVPPQFQEVCARKTGSHLVRMDSGHSPMLNRTDELVGMIISAVEGAMSGGLH